MRRTQTDNIKARRVKRTNTYTITGITETQMGALMHLAGKQHSNELDPLQPLAGLYERLREGYPFQAYRDDKFRTERPAGIGADSIGYKLFVR